MEILSPSTRRFDLILKRSRYEAAGRQHYWVIDPNEPIGEPGVYSVCMARVNVSIPDEVIERAREAGLNVSRIATSALEDALERRLKTELALQYLAELEAELGPITDEERRRADAILDGVS